ncbi:MAG: hypothetical protein ACJ8DC_10245 [Gemmatimonadales bacterium]
MEEDAPAWLVHVQEHTGFLARLRGNAGRHFEDIFMRGSSAGQPEPVSPRTATEAAGGRRRP